VDAGEALERVPEPLADAWFSVAASMMRSALATWERLVPPEMRARVASASAWLSVPFFTCRPRLPVMVAMPLARAASLTSIRRTE
jgi:hypothetical protein